MPAYYSATVTNFWGTDDSTVLGKLTAGAREDIHRPIEPEQIGAWQLQLQYLKRSCAEFPALLPKVVAPSILIEYPIPRRERRIDTILLLNDLIFVLEFKVGAREFSSQDRRQVEDYALDLRDFHAESRHRTIIPVLVASDAPFILPAEADALSDVVKPIHATNASRLAAVVASAYRHYHDPDASRIQLGAWENAPYKPVPTIIEAAEMLYAGNNVRDIALAHADVHNLTETSDRLADIIKRAQKKSKKVICFVTGVPGAGKTLVGLNIVHNRTLWQEGRPAATLLSGNGPLVRIVREALTRDHARRTGESRQAARRVVSTFIENVHNFIKVHYGRQSKDPSYNRVVVFDEAQRAWDRAQEFRKFKRDTSEPEIMLSIMDRHPDWAVIIALVGGGQEIFTGEAGLAAWGTAISERFPNWEIVASPEAIRGGPSVAGSSLFEGGGSDSVVVTQEPLMHLPVSVRSFRAEAITDWVNAVLAGEPDKAKAAYERLKDLPVLVTRSLEETRKRLLKGLAGFRRCGLVASSGAIRHRAYGLEVSSGFTSGYAWEEWFLAPPEDVRSSSRLEVPATEFQCQGLELDRVGICWAGDFTWDRHAEGWEYRHFTGNKWHQVRQATNRRYLLNKYRVMLTRARDVVVIWVPRGIKDDPTLDPERLDATAEYLRRCGVAPVS
jgi:hypothetical protein